MGKYRDAPCIYYICYGECKKGFKAEHNTKCQKCEKYMARKGFKHINKKKENEEKYYE